MKAKNLVVSRFGEQKEGHTILVKHPHQSSFAAMLLLRRQLLFEEGDEKYQWEHSFSFREKTYKKVIERNKAANDGKLVCEYCGKEVVYLGDDFKPYSWAFQLDHIIPKAKGGPLTDLTNLASCCVTCNKAKGIKMGYFDENGKPTWEGRD